MRRLIFFTGNAFDLQGLTRGTHHDYWLTELTGH